METMDLFSNLARPPERLGPGAILLSKFADSATLFAEIEKLMAVSPLRIMTTPGGRQMSVGMTNCGALGWTSGPGGYRYVASDPTTGRAWPAMPSSFRELARRSAAAAGFGGFEPDCCLINCYRPGTRLSLHQDRDEAGFDDPIVSVSIGLPATFLWGGPERSSPVRKVPLVDGDVIVFGGSSRLTYHGVAEIEDGQHPLTGARRFNLTFRKAGLAAGGLAAGGPAAG